MPNSADSDRKARLMEGWLHLGYPWEIRTVADFISAGMGITLYCRRCDRYRDLDLVSLGEAKGRDYDLYTKEFDAALRCAECGAKNPQTLVNSQTEAGLRQTDFGRMR